MLNEQQRQDLEFISNPDSWPNIAILPIVNRKKPVGMFPKSGFLVEGEGSKIYLKNMFDINRLIPLWEQLIGVDVDEYKTYEEMLEDGWEVD